MIDDKLKKLLEDQNRLSHLIIGSAELDRLAEQFRAWSEPFEASNKLLKAFEDVDRQDELLRAGLGPAEELRTVLEQFAEPSGLEEFEKIDKAFREYEERFRLPAIDEAVRLLQLNDDRFLEVAGRHNEELASLQRAVESMRSPWLDSTKELESLSGFTALQGIGRALEKLPAFDERLSQLLRSDLGDWRDQLTFPERIFDDIVLRSEFYAARGFDPHLTDFPIDTGHASIDADQRTLARPGVNVGAG